MGNLNIVEILKLGLPGLIFLLSIMSYRLLSKEQSTATPRSSILSTLKRFMYVNILFAVLTVLAPLVDSTLQPSVEKTLSSVRVTTRSMALHKGDAAVCHGLSYANRYLLVKGTQTEGKMIQVFSGTIMPCSTPENTLALNEEDVRTLGWQPGDIPGAVEAIVAPPGLQFVMR